MGQNGSNQSPRGEWTTVSVRKETYRQAKSMKRGGESWDSLMQKLIRGYKSEDSTQK